MIGDISPHWLHELFEEAEGGDSELVRAALDLLSDEDAEAIRDAAAMVVRLLTERIEESA